ncbi:DNA-processing protein DprA [Euzebya rosea]|uniref:DNA-processing protein DprA n=1 Tax=Euzebya rosea TaxID=2052804 RepID=UPI000D3E9433|nr:DNA-processing protein DprA [Euzebya rosea]
MNAELPPEALQDAVARLIALGCSPEDLGRARTACGPQASPSAVVAVLQRRAGHRQDRLPGLSHGPGGTGRTSGVRPDGVVDELLVHGGRPGMPERLAAAWEEGGPLWVHRRRIGPGTAPRRTVGIVGTRRPTLDGAELARTLAAGLAEAGIEVVSGFARGIDQAAHRGALSVPGGSTTAVLGTGMDVDYPARSGELRLAIMASGGLISEYAHDRGVRHPTQFIARNRILAGLSDAIVVIEAGQRSGALSTARWAADFGRDVMVVPASPSTPSAAGALALLRDGAVPVRHAADVLDVLGDPVGSVDDEPVGAAIGVAARGLGCDAELLADRLGPVPASVSALSGATGLPVRQVLVAVARLEEAGLVRQVPAGVVAVRR